jgi:hypothetical protein
MLRHDELIENKVYYCEDYGGRKGNNFILRFKCTNTSDKYLVDLYSIIGIDNSIILNNKLEINTSGYNFHNAVIEATKEQVRHLELCESACKYIEYNYNILKTDTILEIDEILNESIKTNNLKL